MRTPRETKPTTQAERDRAREWVVKGAGIMVRLIDDFEEARALVKRLMHDDNPRALDDAEEFLERTK